jgi:flagellar basal body rod protein FlgC
MPQKTNLNVSPYFDDFDPKDNYYKVLFKPGYPVQARELTTLQSILLNQTESFGKHIFKEGSVVIPGQVRYDNPIYAVEIESEFNGIPISLYFNEMLNKTVIGADSGVKASIFYVLTDAKSERGNYTIYVKYISAGGTDFTNKKFFDNENLILDTDLTYSGITIPSGQEFVKTIQTNATSEGSSATVADGVYFIRGIFANVNTQTILLDQYGTSPSYRVGFTVVESVVTSDDDPDLYDNAQGFSNFSAPGADRFKLDLIFSKKEISDTDTDSFVEILRVTNGVPEYLNLNPQYNILREEIARRVYDQSGDFFVKPFTLYLRDSLNNRTTTDGLYYDDQITINGNKPSDNLMIYEIGPGKAYVNGFDIETRSKRFLDVEKPRTTNTIQANNVSYNAGLLFPVNNGYGAPPIGLGTDVTLSLMNSRKNSDPSVAAGTTIGLARIYDFIPESNYEDASSRLSLRLFDVQTYTVIGLTTSITQSTPAVIKGARSKATGYLKSNVTSSSSLTLYDVSGSFIENEAISINGISNGRLIKTVTDYDISDVRSVYGKVGTTTFTADTILENKQLIAPAGSTFQITARFSGISTVSCGLNTTFINSVKVNDIITYSSPTPTSVPILNRVASIGAGGTFFTIAGITTVSGICDGSLPSSNVTVSNITKLSGSVYNQADSSLMTLLPQSIISNVSLENNILRQRIDFKTVSVTASSLTIQITEPDLYFESFDEDRFVISYTDGSIEPLRRDKYSLDITGKILTFNGLSKTTGTANVIATVKNLKPNSKNKKFNKVSTLVIDKSRLTSSGIGSTTLNDGLTYSQIYGIRVQDEEICLNVPDVVRVLAIYESDSTTDPSIPKLELSSFSGQTNSTADLNVGEELLGRTSGSVALVVSKVNATNIEVVYLNTFEFVEGEVVVSKETGITATITTKFTVGKNITQNYNFDNGQRATLYDYGRIIRKNNVVAPTKKIEIIFQYYSIDSNDTGEFVTVNSYPESSYNMDIPYYENNRVSDYIDIRPRVDVYNPSTATLSPFEFSTRRFDGAGTYSKYILAPDENLSLSYSYYLGRVDRLLLNPDGTFEVSQGIPADNPIPPLLKANTLDIAKINLPPYLFNIKNAQVDMSVHKRYRMSDISILEDRIRRVEEYTTLSMLESKTENLKIKDAATGLDRFKSGFFVDNFSTHDYLDLKNVLFRSSIDKSTNTLRPTNYTSSLDLQLGSEAILGVTTSFSSTVDHGFVSDLGSIGVKKTGDLVTLAYTERLYFQQIYATRTENVTPFLVKYWTGAITLNPSMDNWVDEAAVRSTSFREVTEITPLPDINITNVNNITENRDVFIDNTNLTVNPSASFDWIGNANTLIQQRVGRGRVSIQTSASNIRLEIRGRINGSEAEFVRRVLPPDAARDFINRSNSAGIAFINFNPRRGQFTNIRETTNVSTSVNTTSNTVTTVIPPVVTTNDVITESVSHYTQVIRFLRSRNIEFDVKGLKQRTIFYPFFDSVDISKYITPKLLEIRMVSGKFTAGETVESDPLFTRRKARFRLCRPNHEYGPSTNPTSTFALNPYDQQVFPSNYTESSTVLNIDTYSLQLPSETEFYGCIDVNMPLIGQSSGARAVVTRVRLLSSNNGRLVGSFFVPDPNSPGNPQFINGTNTFTLIDTPTLNPAATAAGTEVVSSESSAEEDFTSSGQLNITETNVLTTRNIRITPARNVNTTTITNTTTNTTTKTRGGTQISPVWEVWDPLAQSFYVQDESGIFLTSVEVFFETKDNNGIPVTLQIRPMVNGLPSDMVVPFSEVTLTPDQIRLSGNGTISTKFTFPSPVYLAGPQQQEIRQAPIGSQQSSQFCVVLLSLSAEYRVFIARLTENDLLSGVKITKQPTLGSLFKSQNGSTWSPSQLEDLKYNLYRAEFVNEGLLRFYNPKLSAKNKKVTVLPANGVLPLSKKIIVGLGSTGYSASTIVPGITLIQGSATGTLTAIGGSITAGTGVTVSNAGAGYTNGTFNNVTLTTETGFGKDATANITVTSNQISSVTIVNGGSGYAVGDSLLVPDIGQNVGFGGRVVVNSITSNNAFVISDVQGKFTSGVSTALSYITSAGVTTTVGAGVTISSIVEDQYNDGLHMKVYQPNHAMHSTQNYVTISKVRPSSDTTRTKLTSRLSASELTTINVASSSGFGTFEGKPISGSNIGYALIGEEIISYVSVSTGVISILARGIDGTKSISYPSGTAIRKYEFNGVSLRRINKNHSLALVTNNTQHPIDVNSYFIKVDMTSSGADRTDDLYFKSTESMGNAGINLSQNLQFEVLTPSIKHIVAPGTNITARVRTFSGTSISGNEVSFVDQGFENISLTDANYFNTPRIVCSQINESTFINETPGNRSLTLETLLTSNDPRVSPVIDLMGASVILTTNIINAPVTDWSNDERVRDPFSDPHAAIYISKTVRLSIPANSLKVMLAAKRRSHNDIRVYYQLVRDDAADAPSNWEPFPGYSNFKVDGIGIKRVIDPSKNDGSADVRVSIDDNSATQDFEYTVDDLPPFTGFAIKIILVGSNQAEPPIVSDLRAIATVKPNS